MKITQLSLFLENQPGQLHAPCRILADASIDIRTLSLADTASFGILRLIVTDSVRAARLLEEAGYVVKLTESGRARGAGPPRRHVPSPLAARKLGYQY